MNWFEQLAFEIVVGVLHQIIRNPASKRVELSIIGDIASLANQAKTALGG